MTLQSIREYYQVPANKNDVIKFRGRPYLIVGSARGQMYLRVRPITNSGALGDIVSIHPTWEVEYFPKVTENG